MKWLCFFLLYTSHLVQATALNISTKQSIENCSRHLIIHFPALVEGHGAVRDTIEQSVKKINNRLIEQRYLKPRIEQLATQGWLQRVSSSLKNIYYKLRYHTYCSGYPDQENYAFFVRRDPHFGFYTLYIPDGVPYEVFASSVTTIFKEHNVECYVDRDIPVYLTQHEPTLRFNDSLTLAEVEEYKKRSNESYNPDVFWWHSSFPTTGLVLKKPYYPPHYPYMPHYFSLWDLAPHKGAGVTVALVDTGVAAFEVSNDNRYLKHRDLTLKIPGIGLDNFNVMTAAPHGPENLVQHLKPYMKNFDEHLEKKITLWLYQQSVDRNSSGVIDYLTKNGTAEIVDDQGILTPKGTQLLAYLTDSLNSYAIGWLAQPYNRYAILNFLPSPHFSADAAGTMATHGTHTTGIIAACAQNSSFGLHGIAPQCQIIPIKAFDAKGMSTKSTLYSALKKAAEYNTHILNLSLKIADHLDVNHESTQLIEKMLGLVPYVVAASGNDGDPTKPGYRGSRISYPARFNTVAFDVGAFGVENNNAHIAPFSQYEPGQGPLFVAPGVHIISTGIQPHQHESCVYLFRSGTSAAASIMSGFLALVLGEFKDKLSKEDILKACYHSTFKLADTDEWRTKTVLGVIDMRTALFVLHCLVELKSKKSDRTTDQLLAAIFYLIDEPMNQYAHRHGDFNFKKDFMKLVQLSPNNNEHSSSTFVPPQSVAAAVESVVKPISDALAVQEGVQDMSVVMMELYTIVNAPAHNFSLPDYAAQKLTHLSKPVDGWIVQAQEVQRNLVASLAVADNLA